MTVTLRAGGARSDTPAPTDELRAVVTRLKQHSAMRPVTVLAPSNIAGVAGRRALAAGAGVAAVDVTTVRRLAERLGRPALAPRRPATPTVLAAAWRAALAEQPGPFADIAEHPATVRALVRAHTELRDLSESALAVVGQHGLAAAVLALMRRVRAGLAAEWFDETDLLDAAVDRVTGATRELGAVVLYLPRRLTRGETRFVRALAAAVDLHVVAGLTGHPRADAAVHRVLDELGQLAELGGFGEPRVAAEPPGEPPIADRVLTASDADDEVRCVVRAVVEQLRTTPAHRIAVLYSAPVPYARLLHDHLAAAGVTVNGPGVRPLDERAVARALLALLDLAGPAAGGPGGAGDVPRGALFQVLAATPTRDFDGERIPASRWERLSRSAGVVAGDDWRLRLDAYAADRAARAADERAAVDRRDWVAERLGREAADAEALQRFAIELRTRLQRAATLTRWAELAAAARELFETVVCPPTVLAVLPPAEQYAAAAVLGKLAALENLDAVEGRTDLAGFRAVLAAELAAALPRVGRFGDGVLVAPIAAATGLDVDVVHVCGLSEDLYPGRSRADALLPDPVRRATGGELPDLRENVDARHRQLLQAFAAARREAVASFPRGDLRRSTRRLPSRFLLPTLRALSGDPTLAATGWDAADYGEAMTTSRSFAGALLTAPTPATEQEWRTRQVAARAPLRDATLEAATEMIAARRAAALTRYDGNLTGVTGLPNYADGLKAVSPTALEAYADCPHAFFISRLLRVEPVEQPEDVVLISPAEIGNLVHASLEQLVGEFAGRLPGHGEPWSHEQRSRFLEIVREKGDDFEARGLTGHPRLWAGERARILDDAMRMLGDDDEWRAARKAAVRASELAFGLRGEPPVEVALPSGRLLMRGSADKVDLGADGTVYVTDLKTGRAERYRGIGESDPTLGGSRLQLPVYAYAARRAFGSAGTRVEAGYWFVRKDRGKRVSLPLTPSVESVYGEVLDVLVRSIAAGLFPLRAPEGQDYGFVRCPYCNPDGIGYTDERARWERKRCDPALRELVDLIEPGVPGVGTAATDTDSTATTASDTTAADSTAAAGRNVDAGGAP